MQVGVKYVDVAGAVINEPLLNELNNCQVEPEFVEIKISSDSVTPGFWQYASENISESLLVDVGMNIGEISLATCPLGATLNGMKAER